MPDYQVQKKSTFSSKLKNLSKDEKRKIIPSLLILLLIPFVLFLALDTRNKSENGPSVRSASTAISRDPMALGISLPYGRASMDGNTDAAIAEIEAFAAPVDQGGVGRYPASYSIWVDFQAGTWKYGSRSTFPNKKLLDYLDSKNITPVIFLAPVGSGMKTTDGTLATAQKFSNQGIANGSFDTYLQEFAASASAYAKPVVVRYAWEMNGNWFPWSPYNANTGYIDVGNTPATYISMWKHVYNVMKPIAPNILMYWCSDNGGGKAAFYPGNAYVDYVGFDAYNWYPARGTDNTLPNIYRNSISEIRKIVMGDSTKLSTKPIVIGETGLLVNNPTRSTKLSDGYNQIYSEFADLAGVVYFNLDVDYLFGARAEAGINWRLSGKSEDPNRAPTGNINILPQYAALLANINFQGPFIRATPAVNTPTPTISPTNKPTPTVTPTPIRIRIKVSADTYVKSDTPDKNYNSYPTLISKASNPVALTYFKFTLPNLTGKKIDKAVLRLTTANTLAASVGTENKIDLKNVSSSWTEGGLKYSNRPKSGTLVSSKTGAIGTNAVFDLNVLSSIVGKTGDVSFVLESTAANVDGLVLKSNSSTTGSPELVITYH